MLLLFAILAHGGRAIVVRLRREMKGRRDACEGEVASSGKSSFWDSSVPSSGGFEQTQMMGEEYGEKRGAESEDLTDPLRPCPNFQNFNSANLLPGNRSTSKLCSVFCTANPLISSLL